MVFGISTLSDLIICLDSSGGVYFSGVWICGLLFCSISQSGSFSLIGCSARFCNSLLLSSSFSHIDNPTLISPSLSPSFKIPTQVSLCSVVISTSGISASPIKDGSALSAVSHSESFKFPPKLNKNSSFHSRSFPFSDRDVLKT